MPDKAEALERMEIIAKRFYALEDEQRTLRLEYWRLQAIAYPTNECQHGSTHFCSHCIEQPRDVRSYDFTPDGQHA